MTALHLPERIGAILLPDCTLFPHGALPLHIFEDRYRRMLNDALEGDCIFSVGRLVRDESEDLGYCTAPIGTAGLIRASREQPDGRSNLILHGICRVRFCEWLPDNPYPFARIEPVHSLDLSVEDSSRQTRRLREAVEMVLLDFPERIIKQVRDLLDRATDPPIMADAIAQQFVHDSALRQTLLEEPDVGARIDLLVEHLRSLRTGES